MMKEKLKEPFLVLSGIFTVSAIVIGALLAHQILTLFNGEQVISGNNETRSAEEEADISQYILSENATDYQRSIFDELTTAKENFSNLTSEVNREAYAIAVVKNFIADFYTWSNKESRNDVGGLQFVAPDLQSNFRSYAVDNFYLYLNQYIERYGQDALLTVANITIGDVLLDDEIMLETEIDNETDEWIADETESVIRVEAAWEYETSTLVETGFFQREAIFSLTEENGRISIQVIQEVAEALYE